MLDDLLKPWQGVALRHIPVGSPYDVLDVRFAGKSAENRWNEQGAPTLYLAGDEGVLIAEWGRHVEINRHPALAPSTAERAIYRLALAIEHALDLRDEATIAALSLAGAPACFADRTVARATAQYVRGTTRAQGLVVPSVAFLDQPERWCLVLFLDKLPPPADFVTRVEPMGLLQRSQATD